jgi:hypothetical protein
MAPRAIRPSHPGVAALAGTLIILRPSIVWAHGEAPSQWITPGPAFHWILLSAALLVSIRAVVHLHLQSRLRRLRPRTGRAVPWAVIGILSVYLVILPPHLVHHLAGPQDEGRQCSLFIQGNLSEQEPIGPVTPVAGLALDGSLATSPAPPAQSFPIPACSGRSPPGLWL